MVYLIHFTEWCALNSAILLLSYLSNEPNHANHKLNEWELFEIYFGQIDLGNLTMAVLLLESRAQ